MAAFALDIESPSVPATRYALPATPGEPLILGRAQDAQISLDSRTISRRHAEISCDPFGRWWIRDLGSRNGTLVNGVPVTEHLLRPTDLIQIGEFSVSLVPLDDAEHRAQELTSTPVAVVDTSGRIAALKDFESPRLTAMHLSILSDFGQQLLAQADPGQRLVALCRLMARPEFHGRSAVALRASKESFTEAPRPLCDAQCSSADESTCPYISRTLLRTLLARNEPVLATNASANLQQGAATQVQMMELSLASDVMTVSAVACPIKSERSYTDLLYVLLPPEYGTSEWLALTALAVKQLQQAESTWAARKLGEDHAAIERELSRAHNIQNRLVPRDMVVPGLDFAIGFTPCRWVGGDYVDLVRRADGRILLTIADVCGKGLPAALVASSLHMLTHTAMRAATPLSGIMQNLNDYLAESLTEGSFVTMLAAMLEPDSGHLEIINAGHPAGLFVTPAGTLEETQNSVNLPLGLDPGARLIADTTTLETGCYLALFTDGLTELHLPDGTLLGEEELGRHLVGLIKAHHATASAGNAPAAPVIAAQLSALLDSLQDGMARDDRTFLLARRL